MKTVKIGDLVQMEHARTASGVGADRRIGIVTSDVFVDGYHTKVVKVLTTHFHSGEEIYATWPIMYFEVLA